MLHTDTCYLSSVCLVSSPSPTVFWVRSFCTCSVGWANLSPLHWLIWLLIAVYHLHFLGMSPALAHLLLLFHSLGHPLTSHSYKGCSLSGPGPPLPFQLPKPFILIFVSHVKLEMHLLPSVNSSYTQEGTTHSGILAPKLLLSICISDINWGTYRDHLHHLQVWGKNNPRSKQRWSQANSLEVSLHMWPVVTELKLIEKE